MLQEFKKFILRGNVLDLAIAVIIGSAFGKIVTSLVTDIITPLLGVLTGGVNIKHLKWVVKAAQGDIPAIVVTYGLFLQAIFDFLIIALSIFMLIKFLSRFKKKEEVAKPVVLLPSPEEKLLTEIRDLLKNNRV